jgi:predicted metal-dependent hydrolase
MQENITIYITLIIVALTLYNYHEAFDSEVSHINSDIDQRQYLVLNLPDRKIAANQLAKLRIKLEDFIKHLHINKKHLHIGIKRLKTRFQAVLSESKPGSKFTSYTVNKGSKIYMCMRERDENNRLIDENTLFFVALHELAHVMTVSIGHKKEFWDNFKFLLQHAIKDGYYRYQPYHIMPKKYCGTYISDTPLKL